MLERIINGRTDLVFEYLAACNAANATDPNGVSLIQWCLYYGDVSAIKFLLANGESLASLGEISTSTVQLFMGIGRFVSSSSNTAQM